MKSQMMTLWRSLQYGRAARMSRTAFVTTVLFTLAASTASPTMAGAPSDPDYFNPFNQYGTVMNFYCPLDGICAAAEAINSFVFLDNYYPGVFAGSLVPGNDPNRDALWLAGTPGLDGWTGPNGPRQGYYTRLASCAGSADVASCDDQVLLQTIQDWVTDFAPGTTVFASMIASGNTFPPAGGTGFPTTAFLSTEMQNHEDVELIIKSSTFSHVLGLTDINCDANGNCSIRYQDPNDPNEKSANLFKSGLTGELLFLYEGSPVEIRSAIAESPSPEPSTLLVATSGCFLLLAIAWRRRINLSLRSDRSRAR